MSTWLMWEQMISLWVRVLWMCLLFIQTWVCPRTWLQCWPEEDTCWPKEAAQETPASASLRTQVGSTHTQETHSGFHPKGWYDWCSHQSLLSMLWCTQSRCNSKLFPESPERNTVTSPYKRYCTLDTMQSRNSHSLSKHLNPERSDASLQRWRLLCSGVHIDSLRATHSFAND